MEFFASKLINTLHFLTSVCPGPGVGMVRVYALGADITTFPGLQAQGAVLLSVTPMNGAALL